MLVLGSRAEMMQVLLMCSGCDLNCRLCVSPYITRVRAVSVSCGGHVSVGCGASYSSIGGLSRVCGRL